MFKRMNFVLALFLLVSSTVSFGGKKNLVTVRDGKVSASLAKTWTKVKDGEYLFVLDSEKTVKRGIPVTTDMVKTSLEKKLGTSLGVTVEIEKDQTVRVKYQGQEDEFLAKIGKARIRPLGGAELALESSVSDGGIRANKAIRSLVAGEVRATIIKRKNGNFKAIVTSSKSDKILKGKFVLKLLSSKGVVKGKTIIFTPSSKSEGVWNVDVNKEFFVN